MFLKDKSIKTVAISVCTYQRPNQVRQAIRSVKELTIPTDLSATLIIIDNSPSEEVKRIFEEETRELKIQAEYVEEERRGIVYARNRILSEAEKRNTDYVVLFDDDDFPDPEWLVNLWTCMKKYSSTVVSGKMIFRWPESCAIQKDIRRIYDSTSSHIRTGDLRPRCGTGNTLLDYRFVKKHNLSFNPLFNLSGGEDSHFFESMTLLGAKIVWCNEAIVYSDIVEERATEEYIWRRRYNIGYVTYLRDKLLYGKSKTNRKAFALIIRDVYKISVTYFSRSKKTQAKRKKKVAELKGLIAAMRGIKFENYVNTDGS